MNLQLNNNTANRYANQQQAQTDSNASQQDARQTLADGLKNQAGVDGRVIHDGSILTDPRQAIDGLSNIGLPGTEIPTNDVDSDLVDRGPGPAGDLDAGIKTGPSERGPRDPLNGAYTAEENFASKLGSRVSERAAGGQNPDPNAQGGDGAEFLGFATVSLLGLAVSPPVAAAAALGAIAVGGMNFVYDAWIADGEKEKPEVTDNGADLPEGVSEETETEDDVADVEDGSSGGGDVSESEESSEDVDYVLDQQSTPTPDDTSGDNPNPDPVFDINVGGPTVNPKDTVSTPADPNDPGVDAAQIAARLEALRTGGNPRTNWAIDPGDHGDYTGGAPAEVDTSDLPGKDPVGDPGSPSGDPNNPTQ